MIPHNVIQEKQDERLRDAQSSEGAHAPLLADETKEALRDSIANEDYERAFTTLFEALYDEPLDTGEANGR